MIIVLGTGRSGTSLLMQILSSVSVDHSKILVREDETNPRGFFEDDIIVKLHDEFIEYFRNKQGIAFPIINSEDLYSNEANLLMKKLEEYVMKEFKKNNGIFYAIKDPRINALLPIWQEIFKKNNIEPIYIHTIRNPASVIKSVKKYYNIKEEIVEIMWLQRIICSFYYTNSNMFIVHYEQWFTGPRIQLEDLLRYLGYDLSKIDIDLIIKSNIDKGLNRMCSDDKVRNENIEYIYDFIKKMRGINFSTKESQYFFKRRWIDMNSHFRILKFFLNKK